MSLSCEEYSKTCVKPPLPKRPKIGFQDQLSLNAGQKNCRMLQREHSAILSTFVKLPFVVKTFVLSFFEWPFYTGFTVTLKSLVYVHHYKSIIKQIKAKSVTYELSLLFKGTCHISTQLRHYDRQACISFCYICIQVIEHFHACIAYCLAPFSLIVTHMSLLCPQI